MERDQRFAKSVVLLLSSLASVPVVLVIASEGGGGVGGGASGYGVALQGPATSGASVDVPESECLSGIASARAAAAAAAAPALLQRQRQRRRQQFQQAGSKQDEPEQMEQISKGRGAKEGERQQRKST